jgi:signal peptidase I
MTRVDENQVTVSEGEITPAQEIAPPQEPPRGFLAEWTVTVILLLFGTTNLVQAYVIPTGSMENSLLVGDHLLVDKLSYAPSGAVSRHLLPYDPLTRGDIIVFRYPVDIQQTFVKRVIGVPGDRIRLVDKQLILNGKIANEPYVYHNTDYIDSYRDNFPPADGPQPAASSPSNRWGSRRLVRDSWFQTAVRSPSLSIRQENPEGAPEEARSPGAA